MIKKKLAFLCSSVIVFSVAFALIAVNNGKMTDVTTATAKTYYAENTESTATTRGSLGDAVSSVVGGIGSGSGGGIGDIIGGIGSGSSGGIGDVTLDGRQLVLPIVEFIKGQNFPPVAVKYALKIHPAANGHFLLDTNARNNPAHVHHISSSGQKQSDTV